MHRCVQHCYFLNACSCAAPVRADSQILLVSMCEELLTVGLGLQRGACASCMGAPATKPVAVERAESADVQVIKIKAQHFMASSMVRLPDWPAVLLFPGPGRIEMLLSCIGTVVTCRCVACSKVSGGGACAGSQRGLPDAVRAVE